MLRHITITIAALLLCAGAQAAPAERLSPEDEARMTREAPMPENCTEDAARGIWYCDAGHEQADYLPAVVPLDDTRDGPGLRTIQQGISIACRKVGKNTEMCGTDNTSVAEIMAARW